jgi:hypothetical protein
MATRRVLVFDDDSAFIDLLRRSLAGYRLEIRSVAPGPDNIQALKVLAPELVLISADLPGNAGYGLCSAIRKTLGSGIFIVLTTADLSPHDFSLHGKQRLHADLYLDKRGLSDQILVDKLDKLIGLGPRIGPMPPGAENGQEQSAGAENVGTPGEASAAIGQAMEAPGPQVSGRLDVAADSSTDKDAAFNNDLNRRLTEQAAELFRLRRQLEDALRDGRSSPFSTDFLKLREVIAQKDWEISSLSEQLHAGSLEILAVKNKTEALEKEKVDFKAELERALKREEDLARLVQDKQGEIAGLQTLHKDLEHKRSQEANRAAELLNIEQLAHRQTREEFEALIARLQDQHVQTMKQAEKENQSELTAAHMSAEKKLAHAAQAHREALAALENEHNAILSKKEAELADLTRKAAEDQKLALGQARREFEDRIARLQDEHAAAMQQAEREKEAAVAAVHQQVEEKLARTDQNREEALGAVKNEYNAILFDKEAEIASLKQLAAEAQQAHEKARGQFESEIARLQDQHAAAMKQAGQEKESELAAALQQAGGQLAEAEQKRRNQLAVLRLEHNAVVSEKEAEIEALKQKMNEERQRTQQESGQAVESLTARLRDQHAQAMRQAEQEKQDEMAAAQQQAEEKLAAAHRIHQQALEALKDKYNATISEKEAEIAALKQGAADEKLQVQAQTGREFEDRIALLNDQHAQAEKAQQRAIEALKNEHKEQIDRILSEKEAEFALLSRKAAEQQPQDHQQAAREFETRIAELQEQHAQALKQAEEEKYKALEATHKQVEETLAEKHKDFQRVLDTLEMKHAEQINQLQSEKKIEMEAFKRKSTEGVHKALDQTRQKFKEKITQLIHRHEEALKQARKEKQAAIESIQKQVKEKLAEMKKAHQAALKAFQMKYSGQNDQAPPEEKTEQAPPRQDAKQERGEAKFTRVQYQPIKSDNDE